MPNYYNPYLYNTNSMGNMYASPYPQSMNYSGNLYGTPQGPQYMYSVDGEIAARAWQVPGNAPLPPNTVIPLWDLDGYHVYFKSTDAYGRMNPLRKGRVVFDDEQENLPQSQSAAATGTSESGNEKFVTKDDFNELRNEIMTMLSQNRSSNTIQRTPQQSAMTSQNPGVASNIQNNQNGRRPSGGEGR